MKKKILLSLLVIIAILMSTGCGNSQKEEVIVDKTLFKIKDKEFHLDTDKVFEGLQYQISGDFREINNGTPASKYVQYNYQPEGSSNYLFFRIFYYAQKDFNYVRSDLAIDDKFKFINGKTESIEYKMIDEERTDGTIHFYFINKDSHTYVLHFVSQNDIKDFEKMVLNSLKFEE